MQSIRFLKKRKFLRVLHSNVSLDYKINPPISRSFSVGFLLVLTWANSKHSLLESRTRGALWLFSIQLSSFFCTDEPQMLGECRSCFGCLCWAALGLQSEQRARYPLAVFTWLRFDRHFAWLGGQWPASGWVNSNGDGRGNLYYSCKKHFWKRQIVALNRNYFYCPSKDNTEVSSALCLLLSFKITARIPLFWKVIRISSGRMKTNAPFKMEKFSVRVQWAKTGERF